MDSNNAKIILSCCPLNNNEGCDPVVTEAINMLEHDESLRSWYQSMRRVDLIISTSINETIIPAGLKDRLLESE